MSVRHALLALLSEGPKYGLQLREEFEARTGEVWPLNVGQVYTTLQRLERDGLVESDDTAEAGPVKGFRITSGGAAELAEWLRTPPDLSSPPRDSDPVGAGDRPIAVPRRWGGSRFAAECRLGPGAGRSEEGAPRPPWSREGGGAARAVARGPWHYDRAAARHEGRGSRAGGGPARAPWLYDRAAARCG